VSEDAKRIWQNWEKEKGSDFPIADFVIDFPNKSISFEQTGTVLFTSVIVPSIQNVLSKSLSF